MIIISIFIQKSCSFILSPNTYRPLVTHRHYMLGRRNVTVNKTLVTLAEFILWRVNEDKQNTV